MPRRPSTLQHFSLIVRSNGAILSILMCDFLYLTSSFVTALRILINTKLLTLKLIERRKVICYE